MKADWMGSGRPVHAEEAEASLRAPAADLVRYRSDDPGTVDDHEPPPQPRAGSVAAWTQHYAALDEEALEAELSAALSEASEPNQQVAFLKVSFERGPALVAAAVAAALELPDRERRGAVSLPAYTITRLAGRATEPQLRGALDAAAWNLDLSPRLRGRAAAALVRTAAPSEHQGLHDHLYRERDAHVLASALSAARLGDTDLREALGDLYPDAGLVAGPDLARTTLAELERLEPQ